MSVRTSVGTMIIEGAEYAVLMRAEGDPSKDAPVVYMEAKSQNRTFLVSRVFTEQEEVDGIQTIRKTYATPHWVTIIGGAVIHWSNTGTAVIVEDDLPTFAE